MNQQAAHPSGLEPQSRGYMERSFSYLSNFWHAFGFFWSFETAFLARRFFANLAKKANPDAKVVELMLKTPSDVEDVLRRIVDLLDAGLRKHSSNTYYYVEALGEDVPPLPSLGWDEAVDRLLMDLNLRRDAFRALPSGALFVAVAPSVRDRIRTGAVDLWKTKEFEAQGTSLPPSDPMWTPLGSLEAVSTVQAAAEDHLGLYEEHTRRQRDARLLERTRIALLAQARAALSHHLYVEAEKCIEEILQSEDLSNDKVLESSARALHAELLTRQSHGFRSSNLELAKDEWNLAILARRESGVEVPKGWLLRQALVDAMVASRGDFHRSTAREDQATALKALADLMVRYDEVQTRGDLGEMDAQAALRMAASAITSRSGVHNDATTLTWRWLGPILDLEESTHLHWTHRNAAMERCQSEALGLRAAIEAWSPEAEKARGAMVATLVAAADDSGAAGWNVRTVSLLTSAFSHIPQGPPGNWDRSVLLTRRAKIWLSAHRYDEAWADAASAFREREALVGQSHSQEGLASLKRCLRLGETIAREALKSQGRSNKSVWRKREHQCKERLAQLPSGEDEKTEKSALHTAPPPPPSLRTPLEP